MDKASREARALVTWGKPREAVYDKLRELGIGKDQAISVVESLYFQREKYISKRGYRRAMIGGIVMLVGVIGLFIALATEDREFSGTGEAFIFMIGYGLVSGAHGMCDGLYPHWNTKAISVLDS